MTAYQLATIATEDLPRPALIIAGRVHVLAEHGYGPASLRSIIADWPRPAPALQHLADLLASQEGQASDTVRLLAPIPDPPAIYCAGANYREHVANMERKLGLPPSPDPRADGGRPFHFLKASRCCVGPDAAVRSPSPQLDWEGELVAVMGREARNVAVADALDYVAGYTVGNDLSARDHAFRSQNPPPSIFHHSWIDHKSFEGAAPVGPWIVPADQIGDPAALRIVTRVNGVVKQDGSTAGMIFSVQEQVSYLSSVLTLMPGDIIMTGTPAGVGAETGEFLAAGDVVTVRIEGVGELATRIV